MLESPIPTTMHKSAVRTAADWALGYILLVAFCSLLRATASFFGRPEWIIESMPWPEVFYGPAIAMAAIFLSRALAQELKPGFGDEKLDAPSQAVQGACRLCADADKLE